MDINAIFNLYSYLCNKNVNFFAAAVLWSLEQNQEEYLFLQKKKQLITFLIINFWGIFHKFKSEPVSFSA